MSIRMAIIGCGKMGSHHEEGFQVLRDRVEVVATVDLVRARAERAAEAVGAPRAVTDYREVLDEVDAVVGVLPHHVHHEIGMTCLQTGKHVMMEKPLANSEKECLDLIHTAAEHNRVLMTAYPRRYHPLVLRLKELIDAGEIGEVFQISIWTEQHTRPTTDWGGKAETLGGGQLFSHGCHYIDLLLWMLGDPVRGTHVGTRLGTPWMEAEGTSNVTMEFASGALGYHFGTWGARATKLGYSIHAHGTGGMLELTFRDGKLRRHYKTDVERTQRERAMAGLGPSHGGVEVVATGSARGDHDFKHLQGELGHFVECIEKGQQPETDGPQSLQGLRVIWRLYEAERRGEFADLQGLGFNDKWDVAGLDQLPSK